MAKEKTKRAGSVPQQHLHSRLSFLHQAASYLAKAGDTTAVPRKRTQRAPANVTTTTPAGEDQARMSPPDSSETTRLLMQLRGVSRKSQIRLSPAVKHSICRRCDTLLIPGKTSSETIVNPSKNGAKAWADILEIRCNTCATVKRFPVGMEVKHGRKVAVSGALNQNRG